MRWTRCAFTALLLLVPLLAGHAAAEPAGTTVDEVLGLAPLRTVAWSGGTGVWGDGVGVLTVEGSNADGHDDLRPCLADSRVAVVGTGVPASSNDPILTASGHGSWVAGSICGAGTLLPGHHGIAPGARTYSWMGFLGTDDAEAQAAYQQEHGLRVMSHSTTTHPAAVWGPLAAGADMTAVWAASNQGGDGSQRNTVDPRGDERILLVVAATGDGTGVASYSSRGLRSDPDSWPDLTAPGCRYVPHSVLDAWMAVQWARAEPTPGDCVGDAADEAAAAGYVQVWGTSFAAPTVAGAAAMVLQVHPTLPSADLRRVLLETARPFLPTTDQDGDGDADRDDFWLQHGHAAGRGMVDPVRAVAVAHANATGTPLDEALRCADIVDGAFVTACPRAPPRAPPQHPERPSPAPPNTPLAAVDAVDRDAPAPAAPLAALAAVGLRRLRRRAPQ